MGAAGAFGNVPVVMVKHALTISWARSWHGVKTPLPVPFLALRQVAGVCVMTTDAADRNEIEERGARRLALAMPARCRMLSGFTEDVVIRDVSESGCRVAGHALHLRIGDRVLLRPPGMESLPGVVRWCERGEAGIEFERGLHVAVVEHLHRQYVTFLAAEVPYRAPRRLAA
jgi:hypothetical protein